MRMRSYSSSVMLRTARPNAPLLVEPSPFVSALS